MTDGTTPLLGRLFGVNTMKLRTTPPDVNVCTTRVPS
jgi:hypothetical protein